MNDLDNARLGASSPVYLSEPQDVREQPWFANQVAQLYCAPVWTAEALLRALLAIETDMGRVRTNRWGPRVIDLDLLLFNGQRLQTAELTLPHPRMESRAFVLVPLRDIAPDLVFPGGKTLKQTLQELAYSLEGRRLLQS